MGTTNPKDAAVAPRWCIAIGEWNEEDSKRIRRRWKAQGGKEGAFESLELLAFTSRRFCFDFLAAKGGDHIVVPPIDSDPRVVRIYGRFYETGQGNNEHFSRHDANVVCLQSRNNGCRIDQTQKLYLATATIPNPETGTTKSGRRPSAMYVRRE